MLVVEAEIINAMFDMVCCDGDAVVFGSCTLYFATNFFERLH